MIDILLIADQEGRMTSFQGVVRPKRLHRFTQPANLIGACRFAKQRASTIETRERRQRGLLRRSSICPCCGRGGNSKHPVAAQG